MLNENEINAEENLLEFLSGSHLVSAKKRKK